MILIFIKNPSFLSCQLTNSQHCHLKKVIAFKLFFLNITKHTIVTLNLLSSLEGSMWIFFNIYVLLETLNITNIDNAI